MVNNNKYFDTVQGTVTVKLFEFTFQARFSLWQALKGTANEDAKGPENLENVMIFSRAGFVRLFCQYVLHQ